MNTSWTVKGTIDLFCKQEKKKVTEWSRTEKQSRPEHNTDNGRQGL